jgi:uncharacterized phage-associated protein
MQLQELVYIAHGWCLALSGQPLTGDRPEALEHGPEYRRLANALARCGVDPVTSVVDSRAGVGKRTEMDATHPGGAELSKFEKDILERIHSDYGNLDIRKLARVTRGEGTPWEAVYDGGTGKYRDIPHNLIKTQFEDVAARLIGRSGPTVFGPRVRPSDRGRRV